MPVSHSSRRCVFIGTTDVSSQIREFEQGFRALGLDVLTMKDQEDTPYNVSKVDYVIRKYKNLFPIRFFSKTGLRGKLVNALNNRWCNKVQNFFLNMALNRCDIFVFMYTTFDWEFQDLELIRKKGKKIVFLFCGNDVRNPVAMQQEFLLNGLTPFQYKNDITDKAIERRLKYLRSAELYGDLIMAGPPSMQLALRPYEHFYIPFNLDQYKPVFEQRELPLVMHAPSNPTAKGTSIILNAVAGLQAGGLQFEFRLVQGVHHDEALRLYQSADIIIGQLYGPMSGKLEREAMALGKVVLSSFKREYLLLNQGKFFPEKNYIVDCPIIDVQPDTVSETLKAIVLDVKRRRYLAKKSREYMETYHDGRKICENIIALLDGKEKRKNIVPFFFRRIFKEENPERIELLNAYTSKVKHERWYSESVEAGVRDGLVF